MRKTWPLAAVLMLGIAAAAPAQFTVNGARIGNGMNTNATASNVRTFGLSQMIPKMNGPQMLGSPLGGGQKTLNLSRMLPNFSWMRSKLWPIAGPTTQYPASLYGQPPLKVR